MALQLQFSTPVLCANTPRHHSIVTVQALKTSAGQTPALKKQLANTVTRLNSVEEADDPNLQKELLCLVEALAVVNPTPRPAESDRINARWALLYTLPDAAKGDVRRDFLNTVLAELYDFFYKYVPIIAGSAVGRKADSRQTVKARGQFQTFDTKRGWVENQARFVTFGKEGVIDVNGPAEVVPTEGGERIKATFTEAELKWNGLRIPFPIKTFSPSGYIDTLYLDDDLRVSKGDKGSIFIARRAEQQE